MISLSYILYKKHTFIDELAGHEYTEKNVSHITSFHYAGYKKKPTVSQETTENPCILQELISVPSLPKQR
jgi:hypothetical protein